MSANDSKGKKCVGYPGYFDCPRRSNGTKQSRCRKCASENKKITNAAKIDAKGKEICIELGCQNLKVAIRKYNRTNGEITTRLLSYCKPCRKIRNYTGEARERVLIKSNAYYKLSRLNADVVERKRIATWDRDQRRREERKRNWEAMYGTMPALNLMPSSTSKFALEIYNDVLQVLTPYNIRFKAEFNYLGYHLYEASKARERGIRADLLVEIDLKGQEKPLTIVLEAQGAQHRPLLQRHLGGLKKHINQEYVDLDNSKQALLLEILQKNNSKQLQEDLGKVLLSVKQGFVHVIVYDKRSVKTIIGDVLNGKENMCVYYPSGDSVDKNTIIQQFVNQLFFRKGSWRLLTHPCPHFELSRAFSVMCNDSTSEMLSNDANVKEDEDMRNGATKDDQEDDRAQVLKWLEKIHPKYLNFKPVENLTIDFTQGYVCSIAVQEPATTSSSISTNQDHEETGSFL